MSTFKPRILLEMSRLQDFQQAVESLRTNAPRLFSEIKNVLKAEVMDDPVPDTAPSIMEAIKSDEIPEIEGAATLVPYLEWDSDSLCGFAQHQNLNVRRSAYLVLSKMKLIGAKWAIPLIENGLEDGDTFIREHAIAVVNNLGVACESGFVTELKKCLGEVDHPEIRRTTFEVLRNLGLEVCLVPLLVSGSDNLPEFARHKNLNVRRAAYLVLSLQELVGRKWAVPIVEDGLRDHDPIIREYAIVATGKLGVDVASEFVANLRECLGENERSGNKSKSLAILRTLGLEAQEAVPEVVDIILHETNPFLEKGAVDTLVLIDPEFLHAEQYLVAKTGIDDLSKAKVLRRLAILGETVRPLRKKMVRSWAKISEPKKPRKQASHSATSLNEFAVGLDERNRWQAFRFYHNQLRTVCILDIKEGSRPFEFLKAFLESGQTLNRLELIQVVKARFSDLEGRRIFRSTVAPTLTRLRNVLKESLHLSENLNPISFDRAGNSYTFDIAMGYAVNEERRIEFRRKEDL